MPTYTHECKTCGLELDVLCKADERNTAKPCAEWCGNIQELADASVKAKMMSPERRAEIAKCTQKGELVRKQELEQTAFTPYGWKV